MDENGVIRVCMSVCMCVCTCTCACVRTSSSLLMTASSSLRMLPVVMPRRSDEKGPAQAHPPVCVCV